MSVALHTLKGPKRKASRRRGRGSSGHRGNYSGRGIKGQRARTGGKSRGGFAGKRVPIFILQLPKKRGFTSRNPGFEVVNLGTIDRFFAEGAVVTLKELRAKSLVKKKSAVKILGQGEITKKLTIEAHKFSASALEKIKKIGGEARVIG